MFNALVREVPTMFPYPLRHTGYIQHWKSCSFIRLPCLVRFVMPCPLSLILPSKPTCSIISWSPDYGPRFYMRVGFGKVLSVSLYSFPLSW